MIYRRVHFVFSSRTLKSKYHCGALSWFIGSHCILPSWSVKCILVYIQIKKIVSEPQISLFSVSVMNLSFLIVTQGEEKCRLECAAISSGEEKNGRSKAIHG